MTFLELQQTRDSFTNDNTVLVPVTPARDISLPTLLNNVSRSTVYAQAVTFGASTIVYGNAFSATMATIGANASIYGNVVSGGYTTVGANSTITAGLIAGDAVTIGANSSVGGAVVAGAAATVGAGSVVGGVTSVGASTVGATARINGPITSGAATTIGANSIVNGAVLSGAAVGVGASSIVGGSIGAVGAITLGAGAQSGSLVTLISAPTVAGPSSILTTTLTPEGQDVAAVQAALTGFGLGTAISPLLTTDITFMSGLYSASSLTTTAGITITLDDQNKANQVFIFNILGPLTAGAGTKVVLINAGTNTSIFWNVGSYVSLGANTEFLGSIFATDYVTLGANASVAGMSGSGGGVYSATSYVTTGDSALIGTGGSHGSSTASLDPPVDNNNDLGYIGPIPEPATWLMMLSGFGFVGAAMRRRNAAMIGARPGR